MPLEPTVVPTHYGNALVLDALSDVGMAEDKAAQRK